MDRGVMEKVTDYLHEKNIPVAGAASAEALNAKAPEGFRPKDLLPGAKTVLVFGKPLPLAVFETPESFENLFYVRTFSVYYQIADEAAATASLILQEAGHRSLPLPSYNPLRFYNGEVRGVLSLKHAAVEAGLGKMGKNTLLIHPEYGNVLRFGGLVTEMEWPSPGPGEFKKLCPPGCRACEEACPVSAFRDGIIDKTACMGHCVSHTLLPPRRLLPGMKGVLRKSPRMTRLMERFTYNFFENYGIRCTRCLTSCIHYPKKKKA